MRFPLLAAALLWTTVCPAEEGRVPSISILSMDQGASKVEVIRPDGFSQVAAVGGDFPEGSEVFTKDATLRFGFADGSELTVAPATRVKFESAKPSWVSTVLTRGHVRAQVKKPESPDKTVKAKPRFFIRTPFASIGVRGTDFTVEVGEEEAQVRTLTGLVEVTKPSDAPGAEPVFQLGTGEGINLDSRGSGNVFKFDPAGYGKPVFKPKEDEAFIWRFLAAIRAKLRSFWR